MPVICILKCKGSGIQVLHANFNCFKIIPWYSKISMPRTNSAFYFRYRLSFAVLICIQCLTVEMLIISIVLLAFLFDHVFN